MITVWAGGCHIVAWLSNAFAATPTTGLLTLAAHHHLLLLLL
jgi:hypothetical protein